GRLPQPYFERALRESRLVVPPEDAAVLFDHYKGYRQGAAYEDLIADLRHTARKQGHLSFERREVAHRLFDYYKKGDDGRIDGNEVRASFNAALHPAVTSGQRSKSEIELEFLDTFPATSRLSRQDLVLYLTAHSLTIPDDVAFARLITDCWSLNAPDERGYPASGPDPVPARPARVTSTRPVTAPPPPQQQQQHQRMGLVTRPARPPAPSPARTLSDPRVRIVSRRFDGPSPRLGVIEREDGDPRERIRKLNRPTMTSDVPLTGEETVKTLGGLVKSQVNVRTGRGLPELIRQLRKHDPARTLRIVAVRILLDIDQFNFLRK
ncbi:hypothetical protein BDK51DRAFT_35094, partial [Blyttiomyces helicus]